ncbi:MAG TPA: FecR family protein [Noviherbaspirillum sp.]|nr:FecR family protein [Noviherbaspirillum sp.]
MLRKTITAIGLLLAAGLAQAGEAGRIVFVTGQAQAAARAITLGDAIQEGDELSTGADGYLYLKTVDNGFLILRPNSRARVVAYHVDAQNPANTRIKFELSQGVARTISGQAVKQARQNFRFNTPVAAIGVRGTDFTVFTDQNTSRVAVISGGVVVSGFSAGCGPEGSGPCEGTSSRELFADQAGQLLQVQKGQSAPQLLRGNNLSPDVTAPPRKDEPVGKTGATDATVATATDLRLDPQKSSTLLAPENRPSPPPPSVPQEPVVVVPKPPEVHWGRWEKIASLPADSEALAKVRNGEYVSPTIAGSYFISRIKNSELVLPREGAAAFQLVNSEAYIRTGDAEPVKAAIQDSRLEVDFAKRSFTTDLLVVAPKAQVAVHAEGDVTLKGELVSTNTLSNSTVRGYLGGAAAKEAGYVFSSHGPDTGTRAFGGTSWSR